MEQRIEKLIFASRWLQVPLYLGMVLVLVVLSLKFFQELVHLSAVVFSATESDFTLNVLSLVDLLMVANLVIMVIIAGYENFVSRIDVDEAGERLSWFGKLDAGSLKIKLASSVVMISSIHLLKAFLDAAVIPNDKLLLLAGIHLTFILSALLLAYLDKMAFAKHNVETKGH